MKYFETWNIYFIIVSSCYCVVCVVSLQFKLLCRSIDTQYKQHLQKDCQFYRRNFTSRYFTESCKKITAFCHNYRHTDTRRYFTESCKTNTAFFHNYRRVYRRPGTRRYFTESCKKITIFFHNYRWVYRRPCHNYRRIYRCIHQRMAHIPKRTPIRSYRRICRRMRQIQCARALTHNYRWICRRMSKTMEGFLKFLVRKSIKYRWKLLTEFNATAQKNIILFSVGNSIGKIVV